MDAALISLGSVSSKWTIEEMQKHFENVDDIDIRKIEINLGSKKDAKILYEGKPLKKYDCVFVKGSFRYAAIARSLTTYLCKSSYMPIKASAFTIGHNKLLTQLKLQWNNIPTPKTYLTSSPTGSKKLLERINYPIIMKFPEGTQGKGVMFADSFAAASSMLDALQTLHQPFIIQEYIETGGSDIRAIIVGNKVIASMQRKAVEGEKRANIHAGATGEAIELDSYTKKIAIKAAEALGADICAVDILPGPKGPLVIELNISPGLQGITKITGINVAEKIAKYLAAKTKAFKESKEHDKASQIIDELGITNTEEESTIITNLDIRGNRILLPELITSISKLSEDNEVTVKVSKGKVTIKKN